MGNIFIAALPYQAPVVRLSLRGLLKIRAEPGALSREGIGCHCNKWIPQCLRGKWKRFSLSGSEQPGVTVASPGCHLQPISLYKGWWIRTGGGGKASTETEDEGHKNDEANSISALIGGGSRGWTEGGTRNLTRAFSAFQRSVFSRFPTRKSFLAWGDALFCCWRTTDSSRNKQTVFYKMTGSNTGIRRKTVSDLKQTLQCWRTDTCAQ